MATSTKRKLVLNCGSEKISRECFLLALIFLVVTTVMADSPNLKRKITVLYNEQCDSNPECNQPENSTNFNNLVHVVAKGEDDTLHYLWSSMGAPGVVLVRTKNEAKLTVDWDKLKERKSKALSFSPGDVLYSVAFVFGKLIEYNDTAKKADLHLAYQNQTNATFLEDLQWQDSNKTLNYTTYCGGFTSTGQLGANASFSIKFQTFNETGRSTDLPHLQSTANTSHIELILDHLGMHYKQSRFAIELLVLHDQNSNQNVTLRLDKSIDDEYTPSVFKVWNLKVPGLGKLGSFSQWKPVTYNNVDKSMSNAVQTKNYGVNLTNYFVPNWSIAHAFYSDINTLHKTGFNVSFGMAKDGFYTATNYSSWTISIGYGKAPEETLSLLIIIIISAGLGIPLVLILFGGLYVGVKRKLSKPLLYESLDDPPTKSINS